MASQPDSCFDLLGMSAPCFLGGKLILQRAARNKLDWDQSLFLDFVTNWDLWVTSVKSFRTLLCIVIVLDIVYSQMIAIMFSISFMTFAMLLMMCFLALDICVVLLMTVLLLVSFLINRKLF